jgi:ATP-binding cassette subfamily F protein uup
MATLDQKRASLSPQTTLKDALTGGGSDYVEVNGERKHVMGYMKDFLFGPEQARTPIERLSGGERGRLMLARALSHTSNLLVLDEPTNDLDLETLDLLQEMLSDYHGTLVLVSHDRDFLDRVASSVLVSEGQGRWTEFAGGYTDMVRQRGTGVEAANTPSPPAEKKKRDGVVPTSATETKRRLSFKEKHALETLPKRMDELRAVMARLQVLLGDHELYNREPAKFTAASAAFAKAEADLNQAEEEWLELEILREEIEG